MGSFKKWIIRLGDWKGKRVQPHMHGNLRTKSSSLSCLHFFFGNLYPSGKYTSKTLPNLCPQKQHILQYKVGPSWSRSNPDTSQSGRGTPSCTVYAILLFCMAHPHPKTHRVPPGPHRWRQTSFAHSLKFSLLHKPSDVTNVTWLTSDVTNVITHCYASLQKCSGWWNNFQELFKNSTYSCNFDILVSLSIVLTSWKCFTNWPRAFDWAYVWNNTLTTQW